jgi:membrane protein required for colicin V production
LGGAVVSLAYLGLAWAIDDLPNNQPDWLRTARTRPVVEWGADRLGVLVPPQWRGAIPATGGPKSGDPSKDAERALRKLIAPNVKHAAPDAKSGYDVKQRREMDRLIQSHQ